MNKLAVVIPTIRPKALQVWFDHWWPVLKDKAEIIVVWDMKERDFDLQISYSNVYQLTWADGERYGDLIANCHKSDSIRNLGFLKAAELGCEYIATLDDDVLPVDNLWPDRMIRNLSRMVDPYTFQPAPFRTRGMCNLFQVPVILHHGLWEGIPDVCAKDQYVFEMLDGKQHPVVTIPFGSLAALSGMNLAFHRKFLPAMYFWPQHKYRRYGDIWQGLVAKRVADIAGYAVTSGSPTIYHNRLSDRAKNSIEEANGMKLNDTLWTSLIDHWPACRLSLSRNIELATATIISLLGHSLLDEVGVDYPAWLAACKDVLK